MSCNLKNIYMWFKVEILVKNDSKIFNFIAISDRDISYFKSQGCLQDISSVLIECNKGNHDLARTPPLSQKKCDSISQNACIIIK